jgi:hypothetical protein
MAADCRYNIKYSPAPHSACPSNRGPLADKADACRPSHRRARGIYLGFHVVCHYSHGIRLPCPRISIHIRQPGYVARAHHVPAGRFVDIPESGCAQTSVYEMVYPRRVSAYARVGRAIPIGEFSFQGPDRTCNSRPALLGNLARD